MRILYYSPASYGGIADYAHEQANALVSIGINVSFLCTSAYPVRSNANYKIIPLLREMVSQHVSSKLSKLVYYTYITWLNYRELTKYIKQEKFHYVLLASYQEYLAPLWSPQLKQLAKQGTVFGAVVHDPVRDFVLGPRWWHRWSVSSGYSFLREAFVHNSVELDTVRPLPQLRTVVIPFGPYTFPIGMRTRDEVRKSLNIPADAKVMLAFGHIRKNKNLDLVLRAMTQFPDLFIIIAGKEQSSSVSLANEYERLASELGIADRCRWEIRFILETEIADLFTASNLTLLTYDKSFHSASSVLNTTVTYRVPCVASAGAGALKNVVQKYKLGVWVEPDDLDALIQGIRTWLTHSIEPQWDKYLKENSWEANARMVRDMLYDAR